MFEHWTHHASQHLQFDGQPAELGGRLAELPNAELELEEGPQPLLTSERLYSLGVGLMVLLFVEGLTMFIGFAASWWWLVQPVAIAFGVTFLLVMLVVYRAVTSTGPDRPKVVEYRKLELTRTLLAQLGPELQEGASVRANIDFRGIERVGTLSQQNSPDDPRVGFMRYEHRWLEFNGTLADGTTLELAVVLHARVKTKRKRKSTKIRRRAWETIELALKPASAKGFAPGPSGVSQTMMAPPPKSIELVRSKVGKHLARFRFRTEQTTTDREMGRQSSGLSAFDNLCTGPRVVLTVLSAATAVGLGDRS